MNPIHFALAFIDTFNVKKFGVLVFLVILTFGGFAFFERYTSHFHLSRVEKGADVLEKVVAIREKNNLTPEEESQRLALLKGLEPQQDGWSVTMPKFEFEFRWDKFLWGGMLWGIIGLIMVFTQGVGKIKENLIATFFGAAFFGAAALLSPFDSFYMMAFVTPVIVMTISVFGILLVAKAMAKKSEKEDETDAEQDAAPQT